MDSLHVPDRTGHRLGSWSLERSIGAGSFGVVYAARNVNIDKVAAIKVLHPHLALQKDQIRRFMGEASAASRTRHPGVIEFYDGVVTDDGLCYLVMELCKGQSLHQVLSWGPLGPLRTATLGARLADALLAVHACAVVHRDLKPENILLQGNPPNVESPKILDFGIAKLRSGPKQTMDGTLLGTLEYMSPEQCQTSPHIDHRTDIYSLGVILFECLTGRLPFVETATHQWLQAHIAKPAPDPATLCPEAPAALCQLLLRMLAKAPEQRPQSMSEVAEALDSIIRYAPVRPSLAPTATTPSLMKRPVIEPDLPDEEGDEPPSGAHAGTAPPSPPPVVQLKSGSLETLPGMESVPTSPPRTSRNRWLPLLALLVVIPAALVSTRLRKAKTVAPAAQQLPAESARVPPAAVPRQVPAAPQLPAEFLPAEGFAILRQQVTISDFHAFVSQTEIKQLARRWPWDFKVPAHLPMNSISPELAAQYCTWRYGMLAARLPHPDELVLAQGALPVSGLALRAELTTEMHGEGDVNHAFRCVVPWPRRESAP